MSFYMSLPRPLKYIHYLYTRYIKRDEIWAGLLKNWTEKSSFQQWKLVAQRESYKADWHAWWSDPSHAFDFILAPPNATPAVPHGAMRDAVSSCGYTFLFNLLDYTCGIVPVLHVDQELDGLTDREEQERMGLNGVARGAYMHYDAVAMHGLPVGVQVVGKRLEEERVLGFMGRVEEALDGVEGGRYVGLEIE